MTENAAIWLTVEQAARQLNTSHFTIRRAMYAGDLRFTRTGGGPRSPIRIRQEWLDEWLDSRATGGERAAS